MSVGMGVAGNVPEGEASRLAGKSDWSDQDLLTLELAAERLDEEAEEIRRRMAVGDGDDALRRRAQLLIETRSEIAKRAR